MHSFEEQKKRIVVLGAGESGVGAAVLAAVKGFDLFVSDRGPIKPEYRERLRQYGIAFEENTHTMASILSADEVIKSPGIPDSAPVMVQVQEAGIPVISEIEFAARYTHAKKICITGSNGKTTTTTLIYHMMKKAGLNVGLAGNVGKSFAAQVAEEQFDYYVLELSSFQLESMFQFKADIAILLNITPDHLDRYGYQFQNYIDAKMRIVRNLTRDECFIFCSDDEVTVKALENIVLTAQKLPFSVTHRESPGGFVEEGNMVLDCFGDAFSVPLSELSLQGTHNTYNSMAAGLAGGVLRIRKETIRNSLSDFQGVEHRLEPVLTVRGVRYINDSKATNVNSVWYALECMKSPVVWIAGGTDKGNDYADLYPLVDKVRALVCLGKDNRKLTQSFAGKIPVIEEAFSMKEAVAAAYRLALPGDTVLLSPACASFDLFENYEDRGRQFKTFVKEL
ncbi:MAG: UDP-N-acetylmuramoyl-L-alanine--D-glutamate ligase [Bacteroidales bacterium]